MSARGGQQGSMAATIAARPMDAICAGAAVGGLRRRRRVAFASVLVAVGVLSAPTPAWASFHFMQIEMVTGGVNDDTAAQAIQLRMRSNGQERVSKGRLVAWDANGENPVILVDFAVNVLNGQADARVLAATQRFVDYTVPPAVPDFMLDQGMPKAYLASGSLTFENDEGTLIVWRLSWGGQAYLGSTAGALTNDDDGEFGPPIDGPLVVDDAAAFRFVGSFDAKSASNASDYILATENIVFTNNAGESFTLMPSPATDDAENPTTNEVDGVEDPAVDDPAVDDATGDLTGDNVSDDSPDGVNDAATDVDDAEPDPTTATPTDGSITGPEPPDGDTVEEAGEQQESADDGDLPADDVPVNTPPVCGLGMLPMILAALTLRLAATRHPRG